MKFTTPCFVCVEDADKRKELIAWLQQIGYRVFDWCWGEYIRVIRCWTTPKGISKAVGYPCKQVRKTDVDCGENIEMFKALAAINDENDYMQLFINKSNKYRWTLCNTPRLFDAVARECDWRKATSEEIVAHFRKIDHAENHV